MADIIRAGKGQWVEIYRVILPAGQRAPQVPEETQNVPLEMRVKGFAEHDASVGEEMAVTTVIGRRLKGALKTVYPGYRHDFGDHVPELAAVGVELRSLLSRAGEEGKVDE